MVSSAIFLKEKSSMIVGGKIIIGKAMKNILARVKRDNLDIGVGKIIDCKVGQASVKDVSEGTECGIKFEGKARIEVGDILEFYTEESKAREIIFDIQ